MILCKFAGGSKDKVGVALCIPFVHRMNIFVWHYVWIDSTFKYKVGMAHKRTDYDSTIDNAAH